MMRQYLCLLLLAALVVLSKSLPFDSDEVEKISSCKDLCGKCNCLGFYCGEECLCECDGEGEEDGLCIEKMQETCERLKMPFEVLIQGNTGNRLVRSLFADPQAELDDDGVCISKESQNRLQRNTFSIYKPKASATYDSVDNVRDVEHFLADIEHDLDDQSSGIQGGKRKRNTDTASALSPPDAVAAPPPPAADPPAPEDPSVGFAIAPANTATTEPPTKKELIAASLESLNKKLFGDFEEKKVQLAKKAEDIKSKVSAALADVKLKASQISFVGAAAPAPESNVAPGDVGVAAPTTTTTTTAAPFPKFNLPKIDLKSIDFSKFIKPDVIVGSPLVDIDAFAEQAKQDINNFGASLSNPDWAANLAAAVPKFPDIAPPAPGPIVQPPGTID